MSEDEQSPEMAGLGGPAQLSTDHITTSTRDRADLGRRLESWLTSVLDEGANPKVTDVVAPEGNGMSSETILFTARWSETDDGGALSEADHRCVARIEPEMDKVPVFESYDLDLQYRVMTLAAENTSAPVPRTLWFEGDPTIVGAPFFVMERIDGLVPPDVMPYTFGDNWVTEGSDEDRARLVRTAVQALAALHEITPGTHDLDFLAYDTPGATALERHLAHWEHYLRWVTADEPSPLLEECFTWLRDNLPDTAEARLSWGDARIGNMMFADFEVAAVLDWEMAAIAPPEVDLGWMAYLHLFFQDITTDLGLDGMPDFSRAGELSAIYTEASGRELGDLRWYMAYAAMRHGAIMRRVTERAVLFGEATRPGDLDDMIIHRATLRAMLDGTYFEGKL